jgi:exodeoxyribonuclease V alpha subunit
VQSVKFKEGELTVELWDGRLVNYSHGDLLQLTLAYALTVHRSQGAEFPSVILALHETAFTLLERQLLYTAVTRAKKLLIIVGSERALQLATNKTNGLRRYTWLSKRIDKIKLNSD